MAGVSGGDRPGGDHADDAVIDQAESAVPPSSLHSEEPAEGSDTIDDQPTSPSGEGGGADDGAESSDDSLLDEAFAYGEADLDTDTAAERDEYREALLRVKADFDNYRKRVAKDQAATVERAAEKLVAELLPVLDACEAALGHGSTDVEPIYKSLLDTLEKGGLERMTPEGQPFDPNLHEAVMHEPGDSDEHIVLDSLRTGYLWNGRVVRPAMVKVKG